MRIINDPVMISSIRTGSHQAFTDLFDEWKQKVYQYFLKKTRSQEEAKELTQQLFIRIWKYREALDEDLSLDRQIFQKANQVFIDWLRLRASLRKLVSATDTAVPECKEPAIYTDAELGDSLRAAIGRLPPQRRRVFELKHVHGFSYQEIADSLQISVRTVDNHLLKAIGQLRKLLTGSQMVILTIFLFTE